MVLVLEMVVAAVAVALILVSLRTLQAIRHLGIGKSFWTPVAISGFLFFFGSVVAILFELNFSLTIYTGEVVQISRLLALVVMVAGVASYSRKVTKNLIEKFPVPERVAKAESEADDDIEAPIAPRVPAKALSPPEPSIHERIAQQDFTTEVAQECKYRFGHLRTLPKGASIPDECLSCDKIIECKHSQPKTVETSPPSQSS